MSEKSKEKSFRGLKHLQDAILEKNVDVALKVLKEYRDKNIFKSDLRNYQCVYNESGEKTEDTDDTILHLAAAYLDDLHCDIIAEIVKLSPDLLATGKSTKSHSGQTPLHILIVRKQNETLRRIKDLYLSGELEMGDTVRNNISNPKVEGELFKKTIMEGELPHIVAALTLDIQIANLVIQMTSANIKAQNSNGNTVYHCLVEHAARYPEEIQGVTAMWNFLTSYVPTTQTTEYQDRIQAAIGSKYALRLTNKKHMRPLQLAAKHGVATLFNVILESEKMQNVKDRLFDSYLYDISVIDTVAHFTVQTKQKENKEKEKTNAEEKDPNAKHNKVSPAEDKLSNNGAGANDEQVGKEVKTEKFQYSRSVLEMMCSRRLANDKTAVSEMLRQPAMKKLINRKWVQGKCWFSFHIWAFFHLLIMLWYSAYAVHWADVAFPSNSTHPETLNVQKYFVTWSSYFLFPFVGVIYLVLAVLLITSRLMRPNRSDYISHDSEFIILLVLFSIGVWGDCIWHYIYLEHGVTFLLISLLSGWWFCIFFCRPFKPVSFYVVMIHKVIFGDLLRFGVFIFLALVSFSIAIQILFLGKGFPTTYGGEDNTELARGFFQTMLINIRLMFGLGDIEVLHEAREPILAYIVYLVYVIMTYLVLLNSLIAMISETCASVRENEAVFYHTQLLYVILFLEDILYPFWGCKCFTPKVLFEKRPVLRNNEVIFESYFLKLTDENPADGNSNDIPLKNYQQSQPKLESYTFNIQQPFLEETVKDGKLTHELKWNDKTEI